MTLRCTGFHPRHAFGEERFDQFLVVGMDGPVKGERVFEWFPAGMLGDLQAFAGESRKAIKRRVLHLKEKLRATGTCVVDLVCGIPEERFAQDPQRQPQVCEEIPGPGPGGDHQTVGLELSLVGVEDYGVAARLQALYCHSGPTPGPQRLGRVEVCADAVLNPQKAGTVFEQGFTPARHTKPGKALRHLVW